MSRRFIIRPTAEADLEQAARWYDDEQPGLGSRFLRDVDQMFGRIRDMPLQFPRVVRDVRRALLHTFPHAVYVRVTDESVIVLAILHLRRNPKVWRGRVG